MSFSNWVVGGGIILSLCECLLLSLCIHQLVLSLALRSFRVHMYPSALCRISRRAFCRSSGFSLSLYRSLLFQYFFRQILAALISLELSSLMQEVQGATLGLLSPCVWALGHHLGHIIGKSYGFPHLFPIFQGSSSFVAWWLVFWKFSYLYVYTLCCCWGWESKLSPCYSLLAGNRCSLQGK